MSHCKKVVVIQGTQGLPGPPGIQGPPGDPGSVPLYGNTLFVDSVYGDDTTAVANDPAKPWKTCHAAAEAAVEQNLIPAIVEVAAGTYPNEELLARDGLDWDFSAGTIIQAANSLFTNDLGNGRIPMSFSVTGDAEFMTTIESAPGTVLIDLREATINVDFECHSVTSTTAEAIILGGDGIFSFNVKVLVTTNFPQTPTIYAEGETMNSNFNSLLVTNEGGGACIIVNGMDPDSNWTFNVSKLFSNGIAIMSAYGEGLHALIFNRALITGTGGTINFPIPHAAFSSLGTVSLVVKGELLTVVGNEEGTLRAIYSGQTAVVASIVNAFLRFGPDIPNALPLITSDGIVFAIGAINLQTEQGPIVQNSLGTVFLESYLMQSNSTAPMFDMNSGNVFADVEIINKFTGGPIFQVENAEVTAAIKSFATNTQIVSMNSGRVALNSLQLQNNADVSFFIGGGNLSLSVEQIFVQNTTAVIQITNGEVIADIQRVLNNNGPCLLLEGGSSSMNLGYIQTNSTELVVVLDGLHKIYANEMYAQSFGNTATVRVDGGTLHLRVSLLNAGEQIGSVAFLVRNNGNVVINAGEVLSSASCLNSSTSGHVEMMAQLVRVNVLDNSEIACFDMTTNGTSCLNVNTIFFNTSGGVEGIVVRYQGDATGPVSFCFCDVECTNDAIVIRQSSNTRVVGECLNATLANGRFISNVGSGELSVSGQSWHANTNTGFAFIELTSSNLTDLKLGDVVVNGDILYQNGGSVYVDANLFTSQGQGFNLVNGSSNFNIKQINASSNTVLGATLLNGTFGQLLTNIDSLVLDDSANVVLSTNSIISGGTGFLVHNGTLKANVVSIATNDVVLRQENGNVNLQVQEANTIADNAVRLLNGNAIIGGLYRSQQSVILLDSTMNLGLRAVSLVSANGMLSIESDAIVNVATFGANAANVIADPQITFGIPNYFQVDTGLF